MRSSGRSGYSPARNVLRNPLFNSWLVSVAVETERNLALASVESS